MSLTIMPNTALLNQKVVLAFLQSKQIPPFGFASAAASYNRTKYIMSRLFRQHSYINRCLDDVL